MVPICSSGISPTEFSLDIGLKAFISTDQEVGIYRQRVVSGQWSKEAADTNKSIGSYTKGDLGWMEKKNVGLENERKPVASDSDRISE